MKKYLILIAALLITLAGLPAIHLIQNRLDDSIRDNKLLGKQFADDGGTPPGIAISTMFLGGFRNMIANTLWLRMTKLQEKGRYYELVQLANWILKVQPDNTTVAQYLAWNMAYNLSVIQQDFDARWRWIHKGIDTLVYAIELSPNDPMLYRDLAWIYQNKLGDQFDTASMYYKFRFAAQNYGLFGERHSPDWAQLASMPDSVDALRKKDPALAQILDANGFADPEKLVQSFLESRKLPEKLAAALSEQQMEQLTGTLRKLAIRKVLRIEPAKALEIEKQYGKLDWLLPDTFALYWGVQGINSIEDKKHLQCERIVSQALKISFTSGRVVFPGKDPSPDFIRLPNLDLVEAAIAEYKKETDLLEGRFNIGYATFLAQVVDTFYLFGRKNEAKKYFDMLREMRYGEAMNTDLERFVQKRLRDIISIGTHLQVQRLLESFLVQSAFELANGEREAADQALFSAKQIYDLYKKRCDSEDERDRLRLPPFNVLKRSITENLMKNIPSLAPVLKAELELQGSSVPATQQ